MSKIEMDWKLSPQFFVSAANFVAICAGVIFGYASLSSDVRQDKATIAALQDQIGKLQTKDDSTIELIRNIQITFGSRLVKLESDTSYIRESVGRIEQVQRQSPR